jgi:hypothetical protein
MSFNTIKAKRITSKTVYKLFVNIYVGNLTFSFPKSVGNTSRSGGFGILRVASIQGLAVASGLFYASVCCSLVLFFDLNSGASITPCELWVGGLHTVN